MQDHDAHIDKALDEALGMTFPASDPIAVCLEDSSCLSVTTVVEKSLPVDVLWREERMRKNRRPREL